MRYRVHRAGTIHCLAGCCKLGQRIKEDNYFEVYTKEEANEQLKAKHIVPHDCLLCDWTKDKGDTK